MSHDRLIAGAGVALIGQRLKPSQLSLRCLWLEIFHHIF